MAKSGKSKKLKKNSGEGFLKKLNRSGKKGDAGKGSEAKLPKTAKTRAALTKAAAKAEAAVAASVAKSGSPVQPGISRALRVGEGFELAAVDTRSTPGFSGSKADAPAHSAALAERASELQERLYAQGATGGTKRVLLVVQGMDTSGKGGVMRHVVGAIDPQGVKITAFKAPTAEEKKHPFLWRIRAALPKAGIIGVFDRSHYEDVLIVRVRNLVEQRVWSRRYAQINSFEDKLVAEGTVIIKVMLHISEDEQKARLMERLDRPDKHWKFNPGDIEERRLWPAYQEAYQAALTKCSSDDAPWYVIPADRKWYAQLAVLNILVEQLERMDLSWPEADFDVAAARAELDQT